MRNLRMSYCVECGDDAEVCFCEMEKKPMSEYLGALKECFDLKCYCRRHMPAG